MKEQLLDEVLQAMTHTLTHDQIRELKFVFFLKFENYNVTKKCTEIALDDVSYLDYLYRFLASKKLEGRSEGTLMQYKLHIYMLLETIRKPVREICTEDLFVYFAKYRGSHEIKNSSLDHKRRVINTFFAWLCKKKYIAENPAIGLEKIHAEKTLKKPYSDEERERLKCACGRERDLAIVELLYSTGMRVSELTRLNRQDIRKADNAVTVKGKGNKEREVYINASARLHLENYINLRQDGNDALFVSLKNPEKRLKKNGIERMLKRLEKLSGVKNVHPHRYRRTAITNALNRGMPVQEVQIMAGHSDLNTTMIYFTANKESIKHSCSIYLSA